ncbi:uncharacterized protein LOC142321385 [Lycorma delicatula]|uniref:uncharacterized protein LOC142321385 n=1 Tax=Lycorma delicatula TaxID=130591 RepID=UPI003F510C79
MKVIEERASVIDKNNDSNGKNGHLSKTVTNIDIETATPITQQSDGDKSSSSGKGSHKSVVGTGKRKLINRSHTSSGGECDSHDVTSSSNSHLSSVGYVSGDKHISHPWSRNCVPDEYSPHSNKEYNNVTYKNGNSSEIDGRILTSTYHTSITAALNDLKDDIMHSKKISRMKNDDGHHLSLKTVSKKLVSNVGAAGGNQQVFIQGKSGEFVVTTRSAALKNNSRAVWMEEVSELDLRTPLDLAIIVQRMFAPISTISFGLLGGVALMQLFMSYSYIHNRNSVEDMIMFVGSYNIFARVAPTAFYILLAICIVAIFDRFDLAHLDIHHCADTLLYRHGWFLLVLYITTLIITLCTAELDDMLLLYPHDKTFTTDQQDMIFRLSQWHTLNVFRCLLAMLGWFIMAISEPEDLLLHHLKSIKQFDLHPKEILVVGSPSTYNEDKY